MLGVRQKRGQMVLNQSEPQIEVVGTWSDFICIVKPTEYAELSCDGNKRRKVKDNFKVWGLIKNKD